MTKHFPPGPPCFEVDCSSTLPAGGLQSVTYFIPEEEETLPALLGFWVLQSEAAL